MKCLTLKYQDDGIYLYSPEKIHQIHNFRKSLFSQKITLYRLHGNKKVSLCFRKVLFIEKEHRRSDTA
jgi:hypothetical protein